MNACWVWVLAGERVDTSVLARCSPTELTSAPGPGTQEGLPSGPGELALFQGKITPRDNASKGVRGQAALVREYAESRARGVPSGARVTL